jgi:CheY-like chemotaxis protein
MISDKMKILAAEDESICQMSIKSFAKKLNIDCDFAKNGLEAVQKVKEADYNLILMDMYMPEMDGKLATEEIRKLTNGDKQIIIAMSGGKLYNIINLTL